MLLLLSGNVKKEETDTDENGENIEEHNGRDGCKGHNLAFSAKKILAVQKNNAPTSPDTTISNFSVSSLETNGLRTKVANTTCPMSARIEDRALRCEEVRVIFICTITLLLFYYIRRRTARILPPLKPIDLTSDSMY